MMMMLEQTNKQTNKISMAQKPIETHTGVASKTKEKGMKGGVVSKSGR